MAGKLEKKGKPNVGKNTWEVKKKDCRAYVMSLLIVKYAWYTVMCEGKKES